MEDEKREGEDIQDGRCRAEKLREGEKKGKKGDRKT